MINFKINNLKADFYKKMSEMAKYDDLRICLIQDRNLEEFSKIPKVEKEKLEYFANKTVYDFVRNSLNDFKLVMQPYRDNKLNKKLDEILNSENFKSEYSLELGIMDIRDYFKKQEYKAEIGAKTSKNYNEKERYFDLKDDFDCISDYLFDLLISMNS